MNTHPQKSLYGYLQTQFSICVFGLLTLILLTGELQAAEELIYEDTVSVNQSTWSGGSISWSHTISADILARASRVEAVIGARDVDYPECSVDCPECVPADCEHDRLYVNNSEITLLSGANNTLHANPVTIPLGLFVAGVNSYRVDNETVAHNWWLEITESTLKFYSQTDEEGGGSESVDPNITLKLKKSQDKSTLLPGDMQGYTIIVENSGDTTLTGITVTDQLDPLLEFDSSSSEIAHQLNNDQLSWSIGRLTPKESVKLRFKARVKAETMSSISISNKAEATARELPDEVESNTVTAISSFIPVEPEGLRVTKRLNRRESRIGRILSYRVQIENISNGTVFALTLEDILPRGFSLVAGTVLRDGRPYADPRGTRRLLWNLGMLVAGSNTEISYQAIIGSNVRRGQNTNQAIASGVDGSGSSVRGEDSAIVMIGGGHIEVPAEIEARVFMDLNDNGQQNADDTPLEDIEIILSNGNKKMTDKDGKVLFVDILSGFYALTINQRSLPEHTSPGGEETRLTHIIEGEKARVFLPVIQNIGPARLSGRVFFDKNRNTIFDQGETWPKQATVLFDSSLQTTVKDGRYDFTGLRSGEHQLHVRVGGTQISREVELAIGNNTIDIPLKTSGINLSVEGK